MKKSKITSILVVISLVLSLIIPPIVMEPTADAATPISLSVNAGTNVYAFKPTMLGSNLGLWGESSVGYYQNGNPSYTDQRLLNVVSQAGLGVLRFPAGGEAEISYFDRTNTYQWYQGPTGYTRTIRADQLDAFISLCKKTGAEPLIIVNAQANNPAMAADIVKYCNVDKNYGVKYFEIGNEIEYWGTGNPANYPAIFSSYVDAMKAKDPTIKVLPAAPAGPLNIASYELPVLQQYGAKTNAVNVHYYPLYDGVTDVNHGMFPSIDHLLKWDYGETANVWYQMGSIKYIDRFVKTNSDSMVNLRNQYSPGSMLTMTELSPIAGGDSESGVADTFANALYMGNVLGRLAYNGVDLVTQFLLQSDPQKGTFISSNYTLRPVWYSYVMYKRYFGDMMVQSSSSDEEDVTIWASTKTGVSNKLYVMVVNKNATTSRDATINFSNFNPASTALAWELNSSSVSATTASINGVSADANLSLPTIAGRQVNSVTNNFTYTFPAHSVTCFEFTKSTTTPTPTPTTAPGANTHSGTWSMKANVPAAGTWSNFYQAVSSVPTSTTYTASFWMKGTGKMRLRVVNSSWTVLAEQEFTATSTWTQYTLPTFSTGSNTTLQYVFSDSGNVAGTVYIDDCFLGVNGSTNKLANVGFESGNVSWTNDNVNIFSILQSGSTPTPTPTSTPTPTPTPTPGATPISETHSGSWGAKAVVSGTPSWQNFYQDVTGVPTNTSYTASVWVKGTGKIRVKVVTPDWATTLSTTTITATSTWTQYSLPAFNTGTNTALKFVFSDGDTTAGTVLFDDAFMGISAGTNKLANPGFESGNVSWSNDNTAIYSIGSLSNARTGTKAGKAVVTGAATWSNMYQTVTGVPTNTSYTASFWVKGSGKVRLRIMSSNWATTLASQEVTATSTWTQYTLTAFNTGTNTTLQYAITDSGNTAGTVYVDDCFMGAGSTNKLTNNGFESGTTGWTIDNATIFSVN